MIVVLYRCFINMHYWVKFAKFVVNVSVTIAQYSVVVCSRAATGVFINQGAQKLNPLYLGVLLGPLVALARIHTQTPQRVS